MGFDDLDAKMRAFETAGDVRVVPDMHVVARLDGRGFTRLTKEVHSFDAPFDERFRDMMVGTAEQLMSDSGFRVVYAYTQSDEISLLLDPRDDSFGRKVRKVVSVLAGEASARFSLMLGAPACFDCRLCELPRPDHVVDYFRWRNEDAHRNALNAHCYWMLRKSGKTVGAATAAIEGMRTADKNELLFQSGVNFNDLPAWQKRGVGLYWEWYEKQATNPKTGQPVTAVRQRVKRDFELPMKDAYSRFIADLIARQAPATGSPGTP